DKGEYGKAYKMDSGALWVREAMLGLEHVDTLNSLNSVGLMVNWLGRFAEAKAIYKKALEAKRRVLGADDPSKLTSMANLAAMYWKQGRWREAEEQAILMM
ncbi:hypothetical protein EJ04DRAFT_601143, partial [Polyplosphaeria fusca]